MKLPEFTLVHRRWQPKARAERGAPTPPTREPATSASETRESLPLTKPRRVGIWDLGAYVGRLPQAIEAVNRAQNELVFFETLAALPAGTVSQPDRVRAWAREVRKRFRLPPQRLAGLEANVIAGDFFKRAQRVRRDLRLDYLAGVTSKLIADEEDGEVHWNLFGTAGKHLILVSTYDLRKYAGRAGRPFESAVAALVVAGVLALLHRRLEFHDDRGCLFDYNENRDGIVKVLRDLRIEGSCLEHIPPAGRKAAEALVDALRNYTGGGPS